MSLRSVLLLYMPGMSLMTLYVYRVIISNRMPYLVFVFVTTLLVCMTLYVIWFLFLCILDYAKIIKNSVKLIMKQDVNDKDIEIIEGHEYWYKFVANLVAFTFFLLWYIALIFI